MTRHLPTAVLIGVLAMPALLLAQHRTGGETSSGGGAVAVPSSPPPSTSSGGSSGGGSGGATAGQFAAGSTETAHRRGGVGGGQAVPRGSVQNGGGAIIVGDGSGFYPWGYYGGAIAFGGDYFDGAYGAYDPWYGWYPTYTPSNYGGSDEETGAVRLKVKPNNASVYVDGFYAGTVDDYDGAFQRLKLERGPHRLEIRAPGHQPLSVDVMIQEDFTITYRGELAAQ